MFLYKAVNQYPKNKVCKNIFIGPVDVSGMTKKEAKKALSEQLEKDKQVSVVMKVGEKEAETTLGDLGLEYADTDKVIAEAITYGNEETSGPDIGRFENCLKKNSG